LICLIMSCLTLLGRRAIVVYRRSEKQSTVMTFCGRCKH
jgi:hypothetical protein